MRGRGRYTLAALAFVSAAPACGDPGDIEVPWAPGIAQREAQPAFARVPPRAFAKLQILDAEDASGACPVRLASSLGQPCAQLETSSATCVPVRDGESASVSCTVRPLVNVPDVYDLQLDLQHELLPQLAVTGPLNASRSSRVSLQIETPTGSLLDADCNADVLEVQPGAARLRATGCVVRIDDVDAPGCDLTLTAGAEGCFDTQP